MQARAEQAARSDIDTGAYCRGHLVSRRFWPWTRHLNAPSLFLIAHRLLLVWLLVGCTIDAPFRTLLLDDLAPPVLAKVALDRGGELGVA